MRLAPFTLISKRRSRAGIAQLAAWGALAGFLLGIAATLGLVVGLAVYAQFRWDKNRRDLATGRPGRDPRKAVGSADQFRAVSPEDLAFGEEQVARMVYDRPDMAKIEPSDPIWRYCARAFAGDGIGQRVYWDSVEPPYFDVAFDPPSDGDTPCIRFRRSGHMGVDTASKHWQCAVYGLEGLRGSAAYEALRTRALRGEVSRDEWVRADTRLTYEHLRRLREVYHSHWKTTARLRGLPDTDQTLWEADLAPSYSEWMAGYAAPYYRDSSGGRFDGQMSRVRQLAVAVEKLRSAKQSNAARESLHMPKTGGVF